MKKMICFDMDGTIADLYAVTDWLNKLRSYDPSPYLEAQPMWDMARLVGILNDLRNNGHEVIIITWLSKDSTPAYNEAVRQAKREWLENQNFPFDHFHGVKYGATKADSIRRYIEAEVEAILFDDNAKVRNGWHMGEAIDPTQVDIIDYLEALL